MRDVLTTISELVGLVVAAVGVGLWFGVGPALVVAGVALVVLGYAGGRS